MVIYGTNTEQLSTGSGIRYGESPFFSEKILRKFTSSNFIEAGSHAGKGENTMRIAFFEESSVFFTLTKSEHFSE
jgi:hypothetical protein